jgi:hypothetical protein
VRLWRGVKHEFKTGEMVVGFGVQTLVAKRPAAAVDAGGVFASPSW